MNMSVDGTNPCYNYYRLRSHNFQYNVIGLLHSATGQLSYVADCGFHIAAYNSITSMKILVVGGQSGGIEGCVNAGGDFHGTGRFCAVADHTGNVSQSVYNGVGHGSIIFAEQESNCPADSGCSTHGTTISGQATYLSLNVYCAKMGQKRALINSSSDITFIRAYMITGSEASCPDCRCRWWSLPEEDSRSSLRHFLRQRNWHSGSGYRLRKFPVRYF